MRYKRGDSPALLTLEQAFTGAKHNEIIIVVMERESEQNIDLVADAPADKRQEGNLRGARRRARQAGLQS